MRRTTTRTPPASAYAGIDEWLKQPASKSAGNFATLNDLVKRAKQLDEETKKPHTKEQRLAVKDQILEAIKALDAATPVILAPLSLVDEPKIKVGNIEIARKKGETGIPNLIDAMLEAEQKARFATTTEEQTQHITHAKDLEKQLEKSLVSQRERLQPKRPYKHPNRLGDYDIETYAPFARAVAASATKDRGDDASNHNLLQLSHINQAALEVQMFVAMVDLIEKVQIITQECDKKAHSDPERAEVFWSRRQQTFRTVIAHAIAEFNRTVEDLHPRVTAGHPGLKTSPHYEAFVQAEHQLGDAQRLNQVKFACHMLRDKAFEFISGGANVEKGEPRHKLFTRLKKAYRKEEKAQERGTTQFEQTHDTDRSTSLNRLDVSLHVLNRIYEARWALANDYLTDILKRHAKTVADPNVARESDKPPGGLVYRIARKGTLRQPNRHHQKGRPTTISDGNDQINLF